MIADGMVYVSGTTGYDYQSMTMPEDVVDQCRNILSTVRAVLDEAGSGLEHVVQLRYLLPDADDFEPCWPLLREAFGAARPAATMMVVGLMKPEMKIEIEVVARLPGSVRIND